MLSRSYSVAFTGINAHLVTVEANVGAGLPGTYIVGLADKSVAESRDRIKIATLNSGFQWPKAKTLVSLSPAALRKSGSHFDVAMAVAILAAGGGLSHPINDTLATTVFLGELGLDGALKPVRGVLPALMEAQRVGLTRAVIPLANSGEAGLISGMRVFGATTLAEVIAFACGEVSLPECSGQHLDTSTRPGAKDFADVVGQPEARFAAEVAAAGGHHFLMIGPPGSGKSMVATRLPSILPPLTHDEILEATTVHSVAGRTYGGPVTQAPFVAPHYSVTRAALLGGGSGIPRPGAVSLAHHGVLFLDEVSEVSAATLDGLRTPLELGHVRLIRANGDVYFPASFQLVMAANPCRCGAEITEQCRCSVDARNRYLTNLSGPLRDRLDLIVRTRAKGARLKTEVQESSQVIRERVCAARQRARWRWEKAGLEVQKNAEIPGAILRREYPANDEAMAYLEVFLGEGAISQRGVDRTLKLAWTLADVDGADRPTLGHVAQAVELHSGFEDLAVMEAVA
ncbi:MAG: YifB family Mg chelatase-like AAA ATPase [Corynebacterium sp.]|nr:YifB family Mg chelatase-like AAA ATPase [Corynebacterium sp.]